MPENADYPMTVTKDMIVASRNLRLQMLNDPYRPAYHFVVPEDFARPADPNGAIYWNGRYHLGYIYQDHGVHFWGHVSSLDLLHWRHHQPWLLPTPDSPEKGIFSGNCFVNKQGEATMLYHGYGVGNCIATSSDAQLDSWKKLPSNPILPVATEEKNRNPAQDQPFDFQGQRTGRVGVRRRPPSPRLGWGRPQRGRLLPRLFPHGRQVGPDLHQPRARLPLLRGRVVRRTVLPRTARADELGR